METFSAILAICAGNSPVTGEFPAQRSVTRSFDVFFHLRLNKRLSKRSEAGDLRRHRAHYDVSVMIWVNIAAGDGLMPDGTKQFNSLRRYRYNFHDWHGLQRFALDCRYILKQSPYATMNAHSNGKVVIVTALSSPEVLRNVKATVCKASGDVTVPWSLRFCLHASLWWFTRVGGIVMSPEHRSVSIQWQLDCLLNSFCRPTTKTARQQCFTGPLCGESSVNQWLTEDSPYKVPVMQTTFSDHDDVMW